MVEEQAFRQMDPWRFPTKLAVVPRHCQPKEGGPFILWERTVQELAKRGVAGAAIGATWLSLLEARCQAQWRKRNSSI